MTYDEFRAITIDEMRPEITTRAFHALGFEGLRTIGAIIDEGYASVLRCPNLGTVGLDSIKSAISKRQAQVVATKPIPSPGKIVGIQVHGGFVYVATETSIYRIEGDVLVPLQFMASEDRPATLERNA